MLVVLLLLLLLVLTSSAPSSSVKMPTLAELCFAYPDRLGAHYRTAYCNQDNTSPGINLLISEPAYSLPNQEGCTQEKRATTDVVEMW